MGQYNTEVLMFIAVCYPLQVTYSYKHITFQKYFQLCHLYLLIAYLCFALLLATQLSLMMLVVFEKKGVKYIFICIIYCILYKKRFLGYLYFTKLVSLFHLFFSSLI